VIQGLDHVQILGPPGCEDDARAFFGAVLGLDELPKLGRLAASRGVWFACGPQQLHVGVDDDFAPSPKAHPAFRVDDIDDVRERLDRAGAAPRDDDAIPGVRRFYVNDPFGNRLEFTESQR
jgi:catechol 2,3-dioxygenase-like lactoylglutathione lyase family enzyme